MEAEQIAEILTLSLCLFTMLLNCALAWALKSANALIREHIEFTQELSHDREALYRDLLAAQSKEAHDADS